MANSIEGRFPYLDHRVIEFANRLPPSFKIRGMTEKYLLRRALSDRTGREVKLEIAVDPSLIGGAIAKIGDLVFDGSLRTQLSQLRANLTSS